MGVRDAVSDRRDREVAALSFGETMVEKQTLVEQLLAALPSAEDARQLVDDIAPLGLGAESLVVDVGAGRGVWTERLVERYRCKCVGVDVSPSRLRDVMTSGSAAVVGDADVLPFASDAVDVVWCRDTLEMLADPETVLREFFRVVRPGGGVALYTPWTTELCAPHETAELMTDLSAGAWFAQGREPVDRAVRAAGFEVLHFEVKSPQYTERMLADDPTAIIEQLRKHLQLRRGRAQIEPAIGTEWYARFFVWTAWQGYLMFGKLETGLWLLRKPA